MIAVFIWSMQDLNILAADFEKNGISNPAVKAIVGNADWAFKQPFPTVVNPGTPLAASGDEHDYCSMHRFYWPNPDTPDGFPYVYRDGENNPEHLNYPDRPAIDNLYRILPKLAQGWYVTGNEMYAYQGMALARTWFIAPETKMNPHLQYAMQIPGTNEGSYSGIMEGRFFAELMDALSLLAASPAWTEMDRVCLKRWTTQYYNWLKNSNFGVKERSVQNNHGTWYDVQQMRIAMQLGFSPDVTSILNRVKTERIGKLIAPDGSLPEELKRTQALTYSFFHLEAFVMLADMALHSRRMNLWGYETPDGRSLRKAIDFLLPYVTLEKPWPYQQVGAVDKNPVRRVLTRAAAAYQDSKYTDALAIFEESGL